MLAIIIPYYKITFFEATLQSLLSQTDNRFKVYIGDDASIESPLVLLEKYQDRIDFNYNRFQVNYGNFSLVKQWNRCLEMINDEEWVMFLGDDDVLQDNVVSEFYRNLNEINMQVDVVRFSTCKIDALGLITSPNFTHPKLENSADFLFRNVRSSLSEYVFRKNKVIEIGFRDFPLGWYSDVLAVLEFSNFKNVYSINIAKVFVRITDLSISGKQDNVKLKQKATFKFYYYLIMFKLNHFNPFQRIKLFKQINKSYINDKKNYKFFLKLTYFYWSRLLVVQYFQFLRSLIVNIINTKICE
jgi:glycosyltransferase involved in cell wall biosynthesis